MALVNQTLKLEITPGGVPQTLHVTEYDENMQVTVQLLQRGQAYTIPSGVTAKVEGSFSGRYPFSENADDVSGDAVTFTVSKNMTPCAGRAWVKIKLTQNSKPVHSCGFWLDCDRAGVEAGAVIQDSGFQEQIAAAVNDYLDEHGGGVLPAGGQRGQALLSDGNDGAYWGTVQGGGTGLSDDAKAALLACFRNVAWIGSDGQDYYNDLYDALYPPAPPATLLSISASFNQGSVVIYDTDSLDTLKQYLTVTATYDDSSTGVVTNYTLSGTLTEGTSTITVSYGGKTATFNVTVSHVSTTEYALHQDAGYTGQINFGLSPQDDGVAKIEVTLDLPTYTGSTSKVLFNAPGWIGFNNTDWKYNNSTTTPPEKVNRALSAVMGQGKQTVVFNGWPLGGSWQKVIIAYGTASYNPEVTWYEIKMYDSNDNIIADWKPTSTTGEFYDSIGNRTVTASVTTGLEVIEVTT